MTKSKTIVMALAVLGVFSALATGSIPLTDVVLWGTVRINNVDITATDNVTITARLSPAGQALGSYKMGDGGTLVGNNYILRIRLESLADGAMRSADAALVGDIVNIYTKQGAAAESSTPIASYMVVAPGRVVLLNLGSATILPGDIDENGVINNADVNIFVNVELGFDTNPAHILRCDLDGSGTVDAGDIQSFVNILIH